MHRNLYRDTFEIKVLCFCIVDGKKKFENIHRELILNNNHFKVITSGRMSSLW